jgi:uncharacterized protein (DUF362 family)
MKIHPDLMDANAVVVLQSPRLERPSWEDFRLAGWRAMQALRIELDGERAVLKPNVTSGEHIADPDSGVTTHPGFVQGMVEYLQQHGARRSGITVAEDPRNSDDNTPRHWRATGFEQVAAQTGAKLHCPTTYTSVRKTVPNALALPSLNVSRLAVAPGSVLFNVPKLKTHNLAITTLCMKNLMGLVFARERHFCAQSWREQPEAVRTNPRPRYEWLEQADHENWQAGLARRLADTAKVIQPALNLVEGIVGREGTGFQRGRNRGLGLVVAGANMVAVDSLTSWLMGFDPQRLIYLRVAAEAGLGENRIEQLKVYLEQDGELRRCTDLDALRAASINPPFRVISGLRGEDLDPFNLASQAPPSGRDPVLTVHKV